MRMLDWITACFAVGVVVGMASGVALVWFGVELVSGPIVVAGGKIFESPNMRVVGVFSLGMAVGCFIAAGYCAWVLYSKYRDWRQWMRFNPPRSYWDVAQEAEEKREGR
jgi:hypothetical protein